MVELKGLSKSTLEIRNNLNNGYWVTAMEKRRSENKDKEIIAIHTYWQQRKNGWTNKKTEYFLKI